MVVLFLLSDEDWSNNNQIANLVNGEEVQPIDLTDLSLDQADELDKLDQYMNTLEYSRTLVWLGSDASVKSDIRTWLSDKYDIYVNISVLG